MQNNAFIFWVFICLLLITKDVSANVFQLAKTKNNTAHVLQDSLKMDSVNLADSKLDTTISEDAIKSKVKYLANDSMKFDMESGKVYLWNDAEVYYEDVVLKADYIELDLNNNMVVADGLMDSSGVKQGMPVFKDKTSEYEAGRMVYNFKTKKGKISEVRTQEGDGYIKGNEVRKTPTDVIYVKNGYYTTCSLDDPHFSLATSKLKVIPGEKIIAGPTVLKFGDVPTPLGLPFGIFPNTKERSSGILIPSYGDSPTRGFFLTDGGYYLGISDNMDLSLTGDIYSKGSWGANLSSNYKKRYRFGGMVNLEYNKILNSYPEFPDYSESQDFFVRWYHTLDPKANPYSSFSANVNVGTNTNFQNDINSSSYEYLSNVFQSNISYSKRFPGKPFNFTASARHSQNTQTGAFNVTLPAVSFSMNRQMPFRNSAGLSRALKNLGVSYSANATNELRTQDTLLSLNNINQLGNDFRSGVIHSLPISTSMKLFKYFNLNPAITLSEIWAFRSINKEFDPETGLLQRDTVSGFVRGGNASASATLSTKLYGMYQFRGGKINAIRHVVTPQFSFNYVPEQKDGLRTYKDTVGKIVEYSIFEDAIYGRPNREERGVIGFNLMNNLEMKVKSDQDSTGLKKVKIFENLSLFTSYDIAADSLNLSPLVIEGRTRITDNINFQFDGTFDPYMQDTNGLRIDKMMLSNNSGLARLTEASFSLNFVLRGGEKEQKEKQSDIASEDEMDYINSHPEQFVDFSIPWSLRMSYNWFYTKPRFDKTITQTLNFSGDLKITDNWKVGFTSGWDFEKSDFSYTSMNIYRDLHCWEMSVRVIPFGRRQSYVFTINVKSPVLQDLKLNRRRNFYDVIR